MDPRMKTRILLSGLNACGVNGVLVLHCVIYLDVTGSRVHTGPRMSHVFCMVKGNVCDTQDHVWHTGSRNSIPVNTGSHVHRQSHEVSIVYVVPPIGCSRCLVAPRVASKTYNGAVLHQPAVRPRCGTSV